MRAEVTNFGSDNLKIYSVIGTDTAGTADELVQVGMLGEVTKQIEDNVYALQPLTATSKHVAMVATPEVDEDESSFDKNTLKGFSLKLGEVTDAVILAPHKKIAIEKAGVEGIGSATTGYVFAVAGKRKFQYKATKPVEADNALLVGVIEKVLPATQGIFIGTNNGNNLAMAYDIVRIRFVEK